VLVTRYNNVIVDFSIQSLPQFIERLTSFDSTRSAMSYVQDHCVNPRRDPLAFRPYNTPIVSLGEWPRKQSETIGHDQFVPPFSSNDGYYGN
jgi:hypothetical protein